MNSTKLKVWYVKLYAVILLLVYPLLGLTAFDLLLKLDPSKTTATIGNLGVVVYIAMILAGILFYQFSVWGKYLITIELLFSWLPLSLVFQNIYDYLWVIADISILYLLWFDKQVSKLFK